MHHASVRWIGSYAAEVLAKRIRALDAQRSSQRHQVPALQFFLAQSPALWNRTKPKSVVKKVARAVPVHFHLKSMEPTKTSKGGSVRIVDSRNSRLKAHRRGAVTVETRGMREPTGIPRQRMAVSNIAGKARMTVFLSSGQCTHNGLQYANDIGYIPSSAPPYIRTLEIRI